MEAYLPNFCYNGDVDIKIGGMVIHFISCINVQPKDPFDMQSNVNLLIDLNRDEHEREWFPKCTGTRKRRVNASYHSIIGRDGSEWLLVPEGKKAWHAGRSSWGGRPNCNEFMFGTSLIGTINSGFTDAQYERVAKRGAILMREYDFSEEMIAGHEQVSPGRKVDPGIANGNFDLTKFKHNLALAGEMS